MPEENAETTQETTQEGQEQQPSTDLQGQPAGEVEISAGQDPAAGEPSGEEERPQFSEPVRRRAEAMGLDLSHYESEDQLNQQLAEYDRVYLQGAAPTRYEQRQPQQTPTQPAETQQPTKPERPRVKLDMSDYEEVDKAFVDRIEAGMNQVLDHAYAEVERLQQLVAYQAVQQYQAHQAAQQAQVRQAAHEFDAAIQQLGDPELYGQGPYELLPENSMYRRNREFLFRDGMMLRDRDAAAGGAAPTVAEYAARAAPITFREFYARKQTTTSSEGRVKKTTRQRTSGGRGKAKETAAAFEGEDITKDPVLTRKYRQMEQDQLER